MSDHMEAAIEAGAEDKARFWEKVQKTEDCWIWAAEISTGGYGRFFLNGVKYQAHRLAYEWEHGTKVPDELHMDHLCRVRECVKPDHLEPVTVSENLRRGELGFGLDGKCRSGRHDVTTPGSVIVTAPGHRRCKICLREASKKSNDRRGQRRKKARQEAFLESPEGVELVTSIRAMIAEEIVSQHRDYVCTNYENPGDDDHPRACVWEIIENITHQLTGTNQITDNAARIAEGNQL